jgi:hypothetical protein
MEEDVGRMREDIREELGELKVVVDGVRKVQVRMQQMLVDIMEEVELQADYVAGVAERSDSEVSDVAEAELKELAEEDRMVKEGKTVEIVVEVVVENVLEDSSEDVLEDVLEDVEMEV